MVGAVSSKYLRWLGIALINLITASLLYQLFMAVRWQILNGHATLMAAAGGFMAGLLVILAWICWDARS